MAKKKKYKLTETDAASLQRVANVDNWVVEMEELQRHLHETVWERIRNNYFLDPDKKYKPDLEKGILEEL